MSLVDPSPLLLNMTRVSMDFSEKIELESILLFITRSFPDLMVFGHFNISLLGHVPERLIKYIYETLHEIPGPEIAQNLEA